MDPRAYFKPVFKRLAILVRRLLFSYDANSNLQSTKPGPGPVVNEQDTRVLKYSPLVSIIIPTYNRPDLVIRAVKSVLDQEYENIEVIVIDDASPSSPESNIKSLNDPRVKYYRNAINSGPQKSRNFGIEVAKGEFINFLDDDDSFKPRKILLQLLAFQRSSPDVDIITCDVEYNFKKGRVVRKNRKAGYIYKDLLNSYCVFGIPSMLIKKKVLLHTRFDVSLKANQEYDLMIQMSKQHVFGCMSGALVDVYESENQITFNFKKKLRGTYSLMKKYNPEYMHFGLVYFIRKNLYFLYLFSKYIFGMIFGTRIYQKLPEL